MPSTRDIDQFIAVTLAALAAFYLARAALGVTFYAIGLLPGRIGGHCLRLSAHITPPLLRRAGGALLGTVAIGGLVGTSTAIAVDLDRGPISSDSHPAPADDPARNRPPDKHRAAVDPPKIDQPQMVVVRPGDCLWSLAARRLPATATNRQIEAEWHRWYRLNRSTIGPNPDLILTGSRLMAPR